MNAQNRVGLLLLLCMLTSGAVGSCNAELSEPMSQIVSQRFDVKNFRWMKSKKLPQQQHIKNIFNNEASMGLFFETTRLHEQLGDKTFSGNAIYQMIMRNVKFYQGDLLPEIQISLSKVDYIFACRMKE